MQTLLAHACEEDGEETWGGVVFFFLLNFFFLFLHEEHCTGAVGSARTKGTWGPLSNRCVHSGDEREKEKEENRDVRRRLQT